jgi:hypothetical protein
VTGLVFYGSEVVGSRFHVLFSRTHFRPDRGRRLSFSCFVLQTHFRRYRGRRVPFSCFALPNMFLAVRRASAPVFMFCAPELIFGGTEGVGSRFHVLRSRTHFWRYRGRQDPFSYFSRSDLFWAIPRASGPVFLFYAPVLIFGGT